MIRVAPGSLLRVFACAVAASAVLVLIPLREVSAQRALSVTVTPPLFQLTIGPGESWASTVKIVNDNAYDVPYYATVMDFAAEGEEGHAKFVPLVEETTDPTRANFSLASWLTIDPGPYMIAAGSSVEIPFSVEIPETAEPGGHYASILIGTQPPEDVAGGSLMKISSYVSSLLFVKISGDVIEKGRIREFRTEKVFYESPQSDFLLRFENTGNTHLKPQGDVTLYNMWGKERGRIEINQKSNFGNVLPKSIRKFQFSWEGESSMADIGRYSAVVTLAFGQDYKQNVTAVTYFWVIPTVPMLITLGCIAFFALALSWLIRRYIRRALELERIRSGLPLSINVPESHEVPTESFTAAPAPAPTMGVLLEPIREGVIDLRALAGSRSSAPVTQAVHPAAPLAVSESMTVRGFVYKYRYFFVFLAMVVLGVLAVQSYMRSALVPTRGFQITDVQVREEAIATTTESVTIE